MRPLLFRVRFTLHTMKTPFRIEEIVDSPSKLAILRVFTSHKGLQATGRRVAELIGYSVPSTHESLKALHAQNILNLEIIGKQHIYSLNENDRIVQKIIRPMFEVESNVRKEIGDFLLKEIKKTGTKGKITSLILYGSAQTGETRKGSDVDVAVVVAQEKDLQAVEDAFLSRIAPRFKAYFGVQIDSYIKSAADFRSRLKKHQPPVSTLMKAYSVLYGKEPLEV